MCSLNELHDCDLQFSVCENQGSLLESENASLLMYNHYMLTWIHKIIMDFWLLMIKCQTCLCCMESDRSCGSVHH